MKRNIFITIMVIVCFVLQSTLFDTLSFGGISPNLLIIITAAFGFMCGRTCGLLVGFSSGLLYDIFFGDVLCFHALIYMYIGYINGNFKQIFYKEIFLGNFGVKNNFIYMCRKGFWRVFIKWLVL